MDEVIRQLERKLVQSGQDVVVLPFDSVKQLDCYLQNQIGRCKAVRGWVDGSGNHSIDETQIERAEKRLNDSESILSALREKRPVDLPLCNCWYAANLIAAHPSDFHCRFCYDTGRVQLDGPIPQP